jgi:glycosyltransferase involved in cell wall biosynthesis
MKLLYLSCHQILEYDEIKLFHEMGLDVFSAGSYAYPKWRPGMPRPGIDTLTHYPDLERLASTIVSSGYNIPQELIDWADAIMFMHMPEALEKNWAKMRGKRVIFRSIGQCVGHQELILKKLRLEGLQIVRYSPMEQKLPNYAGHDQIIRFYKDPDEYQAWQGTIPRILNITQSIIQRAGFVQYEEIKQVTNALPFDIFGIGNENLPNSEGQVSDEKQNALYRQYRAYIYGGTWPAPYTLSFIEAMMTGIPIIAIGKKHVENTKGIEFYEVPDIIDDGRNGYVSDDLNYLRAAAETMLNNYDHAAQIGGAGRATAIELFGKANIKQQWEAFL